jgi:hypothetical protein
MVALFQEMELSTLFIGRAITISVSRNKPVHYPVEERQLQSTFLNYAWNAQYTVDAKD